MNRPDPAKQKPAPLGAARYAADLLRCLGRDHDPAAVVRLLGRFGVTATERAVFDELRSGPPPARDPLLLDDDEEVSGSYPRPLVHPVAAPPSDGTLDFARWFVAGAIELGVLGPHHALTADTLAWAWREALAPLAVTYGRSTCETQALAFLRESVQRRNDGRPVQLAPHRIASTFVEQWDRLSRATKSPARDDLSPEVRSKLERVRRVDARQAAPPFQSRFEHMRAIGSPVRAERGADAFYPASSPAIRYRRLALKREAEAGSAEAERRLQREREAEQILSRALTSTDDVDRIVAGDGAASDGVSCCDDDELRQRIAARVGTTR